MSRRVPAFLQLPCPTCGQLTQMRNGLVLKSRRERAGLTQREFGRRVGFTSPYLSDIERNRRRCPDDLWRAYHALPLRRRA